MNNCIILKHFKIGSEVFTEERCFHDIIDFNYCTDFGGGYMLKAFKLDKYDKKVIPVSYTVGSFENDYIYYHDRKFYTKDFPMLVKKIHNQNLNHILSVLG